MYNYQRNIYNEQNTTKNLRVGELVEVRSQEEILSTLNERGCLDNLPFIPEMLQYCGKRFLVYKRADKTCDTITGLYLSRRMLNAVHLTDLRCDGSAHGGCDATCLLFWKEAWLRRVKQDEISGIPPRPTKAETGNQKCSVEDLHNAAKVSTSGSGDGEDIYSCQATELLRATSPLAWWDIRQYWRELKSGNVGFKDIGRLILIGSLNAIISKSGFGRLFYLITGHKRYPFMDPRLMVTNNTPYENLNLQPGEIVRVKDINDILKTLNKWKNRGLFYDRSGEMLKYCGKKLKVLKRVRKVIDEKTGKLLTLKNESVILEGAICCGHYSPNRILCPRSLYPFWREIWLKRTGLEDQ